MRIMPSTVLIVSALALVACKSEPAPSSESAAAAAVEDAVVPAPAPAGAAAAHAQLQPTQGSTVSGTVSFAVVDGVLRASGQVSGLQPGTTHGFHIHEKGDCSAADGSSAGGHFNPAQVEHGSIAADIHHGGDMPNIVADAQGIASVDTPVSGKVNLGSGDEFDISGRGLIVHADPDDYTSQPTGNAGSRLACAVIQTAASPDPG